MSDFVRVFCPECKNGNNVIWSGTLFQWGLELGKSEPPEWAQYAHRHEKAHNHRVMVEYPSGKTVPWRIEKKDTEPEHDLPCPDCGERMSGYSRLEYDRSKRKWRDIWYCGKERKWFEVVVPNARDYKLRFQRRLDIENRKQV